MGPEISLPFSEEPATVVYTEQNELWPHSHNMFSELYPPNYVYRGANKSLARPGRKQANVSVRMAWISFGTLPCKGGWGELMTARFSMLLKSRTSLTCFRACFLPGRAKDLSAPRYAHILQKVSSFQVFQLYLSEYHFSHLFYTNR